jgi:hypothetical protein
MISMIVSGGQTGADRAALDVAIELGVPHGGWVPRGRQDETGTIPDIYGGLVDSGSSDNDVRTRLNVRDSDGTLILSHGPPTGGSLVTQRAATELGRPCLHLDLSTHDAGTAAAVLAAWIAAHSIGKLNVAGPRASEDPTIYDGTREVLRSALDGLSVG